MGENDRIPDDPVPKPDEVLSLGWPEIKGGIIVESGSEAVASDNADTICPRCGQRVQSTHQTDLVLRGKEVFDGVTCELKPKTMGRLILTGTFSSILGGITISWLREQEWFWRLLKHLHLF